ncbi:ComF family protein [Nonomuraea sp. NPDC000554]|uniref:ComF family protein n=1 Tax=Nonomuraea sp. NPDC000554 TaxID=3154259 RepID=UPI00331946A4
MGGGMLAGVLTALLDLVLPQPCVACGASGSRLCGTCLVPEPAPRVAVGGVAECWSGTDYEGPVRRAVVAYKERGEAALAGALARVLAYTVACALARRPVPWFAVVPVPSGRRAVLARGHDPVGGLAALAVRDLRALGHRAELWPALAHARRVADQAGLSATERAANLAGSLRMTRAAPGAPAPAVVLVDDIVTTGSTLAEAARALRAGGAGVPLAATVAATRRRS